MIHWTYSALRPCAIALVQFFWGEAMWGATLTLRRLRWLRFSVSASVVVSVIVVVWAIAGYHLAQNRDSYSYYEGKVLEERVAVQQQKIDAQNSDIRRLLTEMNTATLLAVRMQAQIDQMQDLLGAGVKVLGAVTLMVAGNLINSLLQIKVRREAAKLGGRRHDNEVDL